MERERKSGNFDQRIADLQQQCAVLASRIAEEDAKATGPAREVENQDNLNTQWDEFTSKEGDWKKKQIYD